MVLSLDKCRFGFSDVKHLGHGLSRYGLHTLPENFQTISSLAPPRTMGELHRLLGMFGYDRSFIYQFAKIARPLNELKRHKSGGQGTPNERKPAYNSKVAISWTTECQGVFGELKRRLFTAPLLAYPMFDRPFILYTDASAEAFAAVLTQVWERGDYVKGELDEKPVGSYEDMSGAVGGKEHSEEDERVQADDRVVGSRQAGQ